MSSAANGEPGGGIAWGAALRPLPGEAQCGDACQVLETPQGCVLAVADGLGHGAEAAAAAQRALAALRAASQESVIQQMHRCHEALRGTRGVVLSLAIMDYGEESLTWAGVGNVTGMLLRAAKTEPEREHLLCRSGTLGAQLPPVYAGIVPLGAGDLLLLHTDGIKPGCADTLGHNPAPPQRMADDLLRACAKDNDDALMLVARYLGRPR